MKHDPVCRTWLLEEKESFSFKYLGERFHFCSVNCLEKFLKTPLSYWHKTRLALKSDDFEKDSEPT